MGRKQESLERRRRNKEWRGRGESAYFKKVKSWGWKGGRKTKEREEGRGRKREEGGGKKKRAAAQGVNTSRMGSEEQAGRGCRTNIPSKPFMCLL